MTDDSTTDKNSNEKETPRSGLPKWVWIFAVILGLLLFTRMAENPYPRYDSGAYVLAARSLAQGQGLTNISHPENAPFTIYPPVLPAYLSIFAGLGNGSLGSMKIGIILAGIACLLLTLRYYGKSWGTLLSVLALLVMAGSTFYLFNGRIQGEVPYLAWTLVALLCMEQAVKDKKLGLAFWTGLAAVLYAALTRQIGLSLIAGAALYVLVAFPGWHRKLIGTAAILVLTAVPYYCIIEALQPGNLSPTKSSVMRKSGWRPDEGQLDPFSGEIIERVIDNAKRASWMMPQSLLLRENKEHRPARWLFRFMTLLILAGWIYSIVKRRRAADFYLAPYMGVILIIPWLTENRFFTVLIPFLLEYIVCGALAVSIAVAWILKLNEERREWLAKTVAGAILASMLGANIGLIYKYDGINKWSANDNDQYAAYTWAADYLEPEDIVLTHDQLAFSVLTGRKAMSYTRGEQKYLPPFKIDEYMKHGGRIDAILYPGSEQHIVDEFTAKWGLARGMNMRTGNWNLLRIMHAETIGK